MKTLRKSLIITALGASIFAGNAFAQNNTNAFNQSQWIEKTKNHMANMDATGKKSYINGLKAADECKNVSGSTDAGTTKKNCKRTVSLFKKMSPIFLESLKKTEEIIAKMKQENEKLQKTNKELESNKAGTDTCRSFCPEVNATAGANCTSQDEQIANLTLENKRLNDSLIGLNSTVIEQQQGISGYKKTIAVDKLNEKLKNTNTVAGALDCSGSITFSLANEVEKLKIVDLVNSENDFEAFVAETSGMNIILGLNKEDKVYVFNDTEAAELQLAAEDKAQAIQMFSEKINNELYMLCLDVENIDIANLTGEETITAVLATVDETIGCLNDSVGKIFVDAMKNAVVDYRAEKKKAVVGGSNNTVTCKEVCKKTVNGLICSEVCN